MIASSPRIAGLVASLVAATALAALPPAASPSQVAAAARGCRPPGDDVLPADTLRDWVSFFDQVSVVRAVAERPAGPLDDPDGSGVLGRIVTVKIERAVWRRPKAPSAPRRFSFVDIGWWQRKDGSREPLVLCGQTRLVVGRRYLALVGHLGRTWFSPTGSRLRLRGHRVTGGVDGGTPSEAHAALRSRRIRAAARLVAATQPYRAAVRYAERGPRARLRAVVRDGYR